MGTTCSELKLSGGIMTACSLDVHQASVAGQQMAQLHQKPVTKSDGWVKERV